MDQPESFCQRGDNGEPVVYLVKKNIHNVKQARHNWHRLLNRFLLAQHCVQLRTDPGAYVYRSPLQSRGGVITSRRRDCTSPATDNIFSIIAVYVDDILICSLASREWISEFKTTLASQFDIKDL
jgi:hypothetical protein